MTFMVKTVGWFPRKFGYGVGVLRYRMRVVGVALAAIAGSVLQAGAQTALPATANVHVATAQPVAPAVSPPSIVAAPSAQSAAVALPVPAIIAPDTKAAAVGAGEPLPQVDQPAAIIVPPKPKPETTLTINIDLTRQRLVVAEHGKTVGTWPISSGREGFRSPTGTFRPMWMSKKWYSRKYDNAPMPHAIFFSGGVALHATQATGMLGRPASHGCIRQSPANAATLYKLVTKHGNASTKISVQGTARDSEPQVARAVNPQRSIVQSAHARSYGGQNVAAPLPATRRVMLVDGDGQRRIVNMPVNDPRLIAHQQRAQQFATSPRYGYGGTNSAGRAYQSW
jgi:lipoprotein-anchoring transpeptidase ErfK/SrfK